MNITSSNFGALLHLTENHRDPVEQKKKAEELLQALDRVGLAFLVREGFRIRLTTLLSHATHD